MKLNHIDEFIGGWFVGNFSPSIIHTDKYEIAVKRYKQGESEMAHYHAVATEITVIVEGCVRMNGKEYKKGDIIVMEPNEVTDFFAITDVTNVVVKTPSVIGDKYIVNREEK